MQSGSSEYCFSIGEFGDWIQPDFDEKTIQKVKNEVRAAVRQRFAGSSISWTLDLNTLSVLRGKAPSTQLHLTIPDDIHVAAIRGWLRSLNTTLEPSEYLWLVDDPKTNVPKINYLCCAYRNGEWHACGTSALREGPDEESASAWHIPVLVKNGKQPIEVTVPIKVEVSWTCLVEHEHAEPHVARAHDVRTPTPIFELLPTPKAARPRTASRSPAKKKR